MYWLSRRFVRLAELPDQKLFPTLAEGLTLLAQNVTRLADAAQALSEQGQARPARILASHAEDEAGKFLILLDAARCPRSALANHLRRAASHLARLLYAETAMLHVATSQDLIAYIDRERKSHYLDGPLGVEWVFRNTMLYWREQALYVDYVEQEGGECVWQDPDHFERLAGEESARCAPNMPAVDLIAALVKARLHEAPALAIIATHWRSFVTVDATHIGELRSAIMDTLGDLEKEGLWGGDQAALSRILDHWTFPLWNADLSEQKLEKAELLEERENFDWR